MSAPRGGDRPDRRGASSGSSGGSARGRSAAARGGSGRGGSGSQGQAKGSGHGHGQGHGQGARRAGASGRGGQEPGASRWSAAGTSDDRAGGSGQGRTASNDSSRDTPGNRGSKARARRSSSASGASAARPGESRQGSVGRRSWDRSRSDSGRTESPSNTGQPRRADRAGRPDRTPSGNRSRGNDGARGASSSGVAVRGAPRAGDSYSSRGRAEPRTPGSARRAEQPDGRGADRSPNVPKPAADQGPPLPDWAQPNLLEDAVRDELSSLASGNAAKVAGHLVATGELLDEDPQLALAHARAARQSASRLACVREAVGVAAYHAGEFAEASRELRAYRRLSGRAEYLAVLADCERAAGRPDAALRLLAEAPRTHPGHSEWVEQQIVEAGARRDLGEVAGALLVLRDALTAIRKGAGVDADDLLRLRYAYADGLDAAGRTAEASAEFIAIAQSDDMGMTDAAQRAGLAPDGDAEDDASSEVSRRSREQD